MAPIQPLALPLDHGGGIVFPFAALPLRVTPEHPGGPQQVSADRGTSRGASGCTASLALRGRAGSPGRPALCGRAGCPLGGGRWEGRLPWAAGGASWGTGVHGYLRDAEGRVRAGAEGERRCSEPCPVGVFPVPQSLSPNPPGVAPAGQWTLGVQGPASSCWVLARLGRGWGPEPGGRTESPAARDAL